MIKTTTGKVLSVVLVAVAVAYALRLYLVDLPAMREKEAARAGAETLEAMGETLDEALSAPTGDKLREELPKLTEWYPAELPCGAEAALGPERAAIWNVLAAPKDGETLFQYRFQFSDGNYKIYARRDRDCDGLYGVWLLEGDGSGVLGRSITAQNIQE